ncbi:MAG: M12 family metallopeptidase, partial [Pseudomonas sp.]|uniref:M12 family metallopeptidase n=1 Tax=Pseudomonas sp. TaxID=306 RepID=UPI003C70DEA7
MITTPSLTYHSPYSIDPNSASTNTETPAAPTVSRTKRGVADSRYLWPQNHTITVSFMDMPIATRRLVQTCIGEFAGLINLKFKFVDDNTGDIRISAHKDIAGTWSELGTGALNIPKDEPTMHIDRTTPRADLKGHILHEFGHALGVVHEHHHPDRTVQY